MSKDTQIQVSIEATDGRALRHYQHEGKTFVESHEDRDYQIRVKNKTSGRIKAVISVDSLNIVNGKPASGAPDETGYILQAYEEQVFRGFRVDDNTVAQFKFVKREKSYATERGEGQGNGVIAVRAFAEKEDRNAKTLKELQDKYDELAKRPATTEHHYHPTYPWYWENPWYDRPTPYWPQRPIIFGDDSYSTTKVWDDGLAGLTSTTLAGSFNDSGPTMRAMGCVNNSDVHAACSFTANAAAEPQAFDMGSGWGAAVKDSVRMVEFEVGALLTEETFYYASLDSLKAMGIDVTRSKQVVLPQAFKQYATSPSGWKG